MIKGLPKNEYNPYFYLDYDEFGKIYKQKKLEIKLIHDIIDPERLDFYTANPSSLRNSNTSSKV